MDPRGLAAAAGVASGGGRTTGRTSKLVPRVARLGIRLGFAADGLARLFLLLVCAVGAAVLAYTPSYLRGHARLGQLMCLLIAITLAMVGAILSDDLLLLLLFWEATSVLSFLLVGFKHDSRDSAR